jgi:hypothetical protein
MDVNIIILLVILFFVFGGGGWWYGNWSGNPNPHVYGGFGVGSFLLILLVLYLLGFFPVHHVRI